MVALADNLRHRITLQTLTRTADAGGGYSETWTDTATVWASIEPLNGYERFQAQQMEAGLSHKITMRYRTGVSPVMRVKFGARIFRIHAVLNPDERNERLVLTCAEVPAP